LRYRLLSWFVTPFAADFGRAAAKTVNDRADNLKLYQDVEDASLDLYAAVRNGYLQRHQKSIADAIRERDSELESALHFVQFGDFDQRAAVERAKGDDSAQTAENRDQIRP
jgi:ABC-type transporter lipoprotein component MlaA